MPIAAGSGGVWSSLGGSVRSGEDTGSEEKTDLVGPFRGGQ